MEQTGLAFSSSGRDTVEKYVEVPPLPLIDDVGKEFDVASTANWINSLGLKRVALQFPDELMTQAIDVARLLQLETTSDIVILADTSYGGCCVDEVAAEHYCCDAIVHFGHACLSPTPGRLPVQYVFGRRSIDVDLILQQVSPLVTDNLSQPTLLLYDTVYHHAINEELCGRLLQLLPNLVVSQLSIPNSSVHDSVGYQNSKAKEQSCFGRTFPLPDERTANSYTLLYIGAADCRFLTAFLMTVNLARRICFDPYTNTVVTDFWQPGRALARRYYLVERARDAQRIGILVGTLGVANYLEVADRIETVAKRAGKAVYRFVVGKLNVAKLANFADIDVFVLVACPENSLLDSKEFYQPIVTPFELEIACDSSRQWTGNYELDFKHLFVGFSTDDTTSSSNDGGPDVSLVTGRIRMLGHSSGVDEEIDETRTNAVMKRNNDTTIAINAAGNFFVDRTWQGLDPQLGKTPVTTAVEGPSGIAMHYSNEPSLTN